MAKTPRRVIRERILSALVSTDAGSMKRSEVLAQLASDYQDQWTKDDLEPNLNQRSQATWQIDASFARKDMINDGLLIGDKHGSWILTEKGRKAAQALKWDLSPGDTMSHKERVARFGGGSQGGIEQSARTPNVFIYSDPQAGRVFGYDYDGWNRTGDLFLYTGEGPKGDQQFRNGNRAIRDHEQDGRTLRVFVADGVVPGTGEKIQRYIGEFRIDLRVPFVRAEAPDEEGQKRLVIVFRLRPLGTVLRRDEDRSTTGDAAIGPVAIPETVEGLSPESIAAAIPAEATNRTEYERNSSANAISIRREAKLVRRFQEHLATLGHSVGRYKLRPSGELCYLYTDLFDYTQNVLYEAKASGTRDAIRMALGQLLDYGRHIPRNPELSVLLPTVPSDDLLLLLHTFNVSCVYETPQGTFETARAPHAPVAVNSEQCGELL